MKRLSVALFFAVAVVFAAVFFLKKNAATGLVSQAEKVDFNFDVKPILSDRCFKCHGPDTQNRKAGLRLDIESEAKKVLKSGLFAIKPSDSEHSELCRRIFSNDPNEQMPPPASNLKLTEAEKQILKKWIDQGAEYRPHWAFIAPQKPPLPTVKNRKWPRNEIDFFILKKLEANGLEPEKEADRARLIRRVAFDLTGLPPVENFFSENSDTPDFFEKAVENGLNSPAFGEKMAASWLDAARYADSHGYQDDSYRTMWPWRDWVIHAFNSNLSGDRFLTWQLAGDLLPNATREQILATGFNRNHKITQEGGVIDEEYRLEYVTDRTNTFGKSILGLSLECAKCHDHKYDPISQQAYFSVFAFFNQMDEKGLFSGVGGIYPFADPPLIRISQAEKEGVLAFLNRSDTAAVEVMVMAEGKKPRATFVLNRGQYDQPREEVRAALPTFDPTPGPSGVGPGVGLTRLDLANWVVSSENPLAARVFVNRIWQEIFGTGLVKSGGDFGNQGELPSHPELLDWLAVDFQEHGWDVKRLVRMLVGSATYQQASTCSSEKRVADPENRFLSRSPRNRFSAEMLRDQALAVSGLLNPEIGGPSVRPYQPKGLWEETTPGEGRGTLTKYVRDSLAKCYRRSLYTFWKRTIPHPMMTNFDAPIRDNCTISRQRTNTPLQALNLLNDVQFLEAARVFAQNLLAKNGATDDNLRLIFQRILFRKPTDREFSILKMHHRERLAFLKNHPEKAEKLLRQGDFPQNPSLDKMEVAALAEVVSLVLNMDEAVFRN